MPYDVAPPTGPSEFDDHRSGSGSQTMGEPAVNSRPLSAAASLGDDVLDSIAQRVLWTATAIIDSANRGRPNHSGVKVGGHQSSSASMWEL